MFSQGATSFHTSKAIENNAFLILEYPFSASLFSPVPLSAPILLVIDVNVRLFLLTIYTILHRNTHFNAFRLSENQQKFRGFAPDRDWEGLQRSQTPAAKNSQRAFQALCSYYSLHLHLLQEGLTLENCVRRKKKIFSAPVQGQLYLGKYSWPWWLLLSVSGTALINLYMDSYTFKV